jgi:hypothetical protein
MSRSMFSVLAVGAALLLFAVRNLACGPPPFPSSTLSPLAGELALTEVMLDPLTGDPEWLELRNVADVPLDLGGCSLSDGGSSPHLAFLPAGLHLPPGGYLVVAERLLEPVDEIVTDVVIGDDGLVFDQSDEAEVIELHCPSGDELVAVDEVPIGRFGPVAAGTSWMLESGADAASRNDEPDAWCPAPLDAVYAEDGSGSRRGTPGQANRCGAGGPGWPEPGQVQVTEVMIAPDLGREWVELSNPGPSPFDLAGCEIGEEGVGPAHEHTLAADRGETQIGAGGLLVLAVSSLELVPGGTETADYAYSSLTFNNDEREDLYLRCGEVLVELVTYDWVTEDADRGRSLSRDPGDPSLWCVADEPFHLDDDGAEYGSPGEGNPPCPRLTGDGPFPEVGEIVVTEVMVAPSSGSLFPEWFEVRNIGARTVQLDGCRAEDEGHDSVIAMDAALPPGGMAILSADPFDPVCALLPDGDYGGSVTFNNSTADRCALACPDGLGGFDLIDEVTFDWPSLDLDQGISLVLDADALDPVANDDPTVWCAAPADGWSCTMDGHTDRGTPGSLSYCDPGGG